MLVKKDASPTLGNSPQRSTDNAEMSEDEFESEEDLNELVDQDEEESEEDRKEERPEKNFNDI